MNAAALLTDGSVVTVCELGPGDVSALLALHRGLPVEDQYLRFFSTSPRQLQDFVERMVSPDATHHVVLGAYRDDRLLGAASYPLVLTDTGCVVVAARRSGAQTLCSRAIRTWHRVSAPSRRADGSSFSASTICSARR